MPYKIKQMIDWTEGRLVTSTYVFDEIVTLCRYRLGHEPAVRVGRVLVDPDIVDLVRITGDDEHAAWALDRIGTTGLTTQR